MHSKTLEFPKDFVHNAPKMLESLCTLHQNATLVAKKAHEQTPKKRTVATKVLHEQKIDPGFITSNIQIDRFLKNCYTF